MFSNVIFGSPALGWLGAKLRNRSSLEWGSDGVEDLAINKVRQTILEALPSGTISKREPPRRHRASFSLEWGHIINRPPQEWTNRRQDITITVCSGKAEANSVVEYIDQTWFWNGHGVLDLLQRTTWLKRPSPDTNNKECPSSSGKPRFPRC